MSDTRTVRVHGLFNAASGLWPLLHMPSFERVFGAKADRWLVRTVAGLLLTNGLVELSAPATDAGRRQAALLGAGTAGTLAAVDLAYAPRGRISRMYLLDAVVEVAWLMALRRAARPSR